MTRAGIFDETSQASGRGIRQAASVFSRVVIALDGTEAGFEACRQAARLVEPDGRIEIVFAAYVIGGTLPWSTMDVAEELEREGGPAIRKAEAILGSRATIRLVNAPPPAALLEAIVKAAATLLAIGTHGRGRVSELVFGGVGADLLHEAPCSVLVAKSPIATALFPRAIVVGVDGSSESELALAVGEQVARRFGASLEIVTALGGQGVDLERARRRAPLVEALEERPVDALVGASSRADLVVVGSRGLHGLRSLGSVSERVAHEAACSVLVVRPPRTLSVSSAA
jgi:nucleotide-binding universal stress UspA family protein